MPSRKKVKRDMQAGGAGIEEQKGGRRTSNVGVALRTVACNGRTGGAGKCFPFFWGGRKYLCSAFFPLSGGSCPEKKRMGRKWKRRRKGSFLPPPPPPPPFPSSLLCYCLERGGRWEEERNFRPTISQVGGGEKKGFLSLYPRWLSGGGRLPGIVMMIRGRRGPVGLSIHACGGRAFPKGAFQKVFLPFSHSTHLCCFIALGHARQDG